MVDRDMADGVCQEQDGDSKPCLLCLRESSRQKYLDLRVLSDSGDRARLIGLRLRGAARNEIEIERP